MTRARRARTVVLLTCLTMAVTVAPRAVAAPAPALDRSETEKAREHFKSGEALFKLERYKEALTEYEQGYLAKSDASFLYNIAQCHRLMGNKPAALRFYKRFLKEGTRIPNREMVEQHIRDLEKAIASAPPPAPPPAAAEPPPPAPPAHVELSAPPPPPESAALVGDAAHGGASSEVPDGPIYERWWFWTAIGVVVVGGSVATYLALRKGPACETGRTCM